MKTGASKKKMSPHLLNLKNAPVWGETISSQEQGKNKKTSRHLSDLRKQEEKEQQAVQFFEALPLYEPFQPHEHHERIFSSANAIKEMKIHWLNTFKLLALSAALALVVALAFIIYQENAKSAAPENKDRTNTQQQDQEIPAYELQDSGDFLLHQA